LDRTLPTAGAPSRGGLSAWSSDSRRAGADVTRLTVDGDAGAAPARQRFRASVYRILQEALEPTWIRCARGADDRPPAGGSSGRDGPTLYRIAWAAWGGGPGTAWPWACGNELSRSAGSCSSRAQRRLPGWCASHRFPARSFRPREAVNDQGCCSSMDQDHQMAGLRVHHCWPSKFGFEIARRGPDAWRGVGPAAHPTRYAANVC